jgi:hypothetical protein
LAHFMVKELAEPQFIGKRVGITAIWSSQVQTKFTVRGF